MIGLFGNLFRHFGGGAGTAVECQCVINNECGHQQQDLAHLLQNYPASETFLRAIFGTASFIFILWYRRWGVADCWVSRRSSTPLSLGRGRVESPPSKIQLLASKILISCYKVMSFFKPID